MKGLFSLDGPLYKIGNLIYYSMVGNILCILLAIPGILSFIFIGYNSIVGILALIILSSPVGSGLTASFYMMRKLQKDDSTSPFKDFWKSLRLNFKQSALAWILLACIGSIIFINLNTISVMGNLGKFILPFHFLIAIELIFTGIYIFPLISKYENSLKQHIKVALMLANGHLPTTISCVAITIIIAFLLYYSPSVIILLGIGLYTFSVGWMIERIFIKHWPEEEKENITED